MEGDSRALSLLTATETSAFKVGGASYPRVLSGLR
jgi:hypothetical protein